MKMKAGFKRMYKITFYFTAAEKMVTTFVTAWNRASALDKVKFNYGSNAVHLPQIKFVEMV